MTAEAGRVVMEAGRSSGRPQPVGESIASVETVTMTYEARTGAVVALEEVDLRIADGEFIGVVGASGCGKSTLLNLLAGLLDPTAGRVDRSPEVRAQGGTGMVFQSAVLLPWRTVLANVVLPAELTGASDGERKAHQLLDSVGLSGFERVHPHQLSGGMQQRVSICRALMTDPRLLLMDEPFGALDAITREQMNLLLQAIWLRVGNAIVLVTHSISEAVFLSDRIVVMTPRPGRVAEVIANDLPRPRDASTYSDPLFADYTARIRERIVGPEMIA